MKKEEIHLGDIQRWLIGQTTWEFMIEVTIRTLLIYLFLLLAVRLLGKRMTSQMTITEFSVMLTLGAIVSPTMQLPDRGIMFGIAGLAVAVVFQRGINLWAFNSEKVEHITQGKMITVVKDGILVLNELEKSHITKQQAFAMLREENVENLGKIKRAYLEASGTLSVFEQKEERPGLPIFPSGDAIVKVIQQEAPGIMACCNCGHTQKVTDLNTKCEVCNSHDWIQAYIEKIASK